MWRLWKKLMTSVWDGYVQEFEPGFPPRPPRPEFGRGPRWEEEGQRFPEFPEEEDRFHRRPPRDEFEFRGRGEEPFFRERDFGRLPGFDEGRRFPDDRRPMLEWEREDPMHPAFRFLLCSSVHRLLILLWSPYVIGQTIYIFILFLLLLLLLLLFFPRLISAVGDCMSTILRHMVWS